MEEKNASESLSRATRDLMNREPFYGLFLSTMDREVSKDVPGSGVKKLGINSALTVNEDYWNNASKELQLGILKHELLHIAFMHMLMQEHFPDKEVFNIAADIEVNQHIDDKYKNETFLGINSFPGIKLEPRKGTQYYYNELIKQKGKNKDLDDLCSELAGQEDGDGNPVPGTGKQSKSMANHKGWEEYNNASDAEKELMKKQIEFQLKETAEAVKSRGTIPAEFQALIDEILKEKPEFFNWKAYLRRFVGGSHIYYTKKTRRKQSKRFSENPGLKIKEKKHLMVAVDTSGSVSNKEFMEFMGQIHHLWKTGTKVTIVDADAAVSNVKVYNGKFDGTRTGNGGTDFDPAIKYFNEHKEFCTLVYFTDGECVPPDTKPRKNPLWVISSVGHKLEGLPGFQIQIPKDSVQ